MYELYPYFTNDGSVGLFSPVDDDIYHSTHGALSESWQKFIIPSELEQYIYSHEKVKILDVCYGIGYNTKTALQVFINTILKSKNSNKKKKTNKAIGAIYSDNINEDKKYKNKLGVSSTIEKIYSDNVASGYADNLGEPENDKHNKNVEYDFPEHNFNKSILIDAVDLDDVLINLSPFISRGFCEKPIFLRFKQGKYFSNPKSTTKVEQVKKIHKPKIKLPPRKLRLRKEVPIIILKKLLNSDKHNLNSKVMNIFLSQKEYSNYFSKYMVNFAKFYRNFRCKDSKREDKTTFLHNIYYKYLSRSYKNVKKLTEWSNIDLNFHHSDAREYIKSTSTKYNFIFLDAFTPSKCPSLWTLDFVAGLYNKLEDDGVILTYSCSAAVRNAFFQNNFYVGKIYDPKTNKFIGTIASKNINAIKYPLDEQDFALIKSKAGICYRDESLSLNNNQILEKRRQEVLTSELISSSKALKGIQEKNAKSI